MKIKSFYTTSPTIIFEGGRFNDDKPICVFAAPAVFLCADQSFFVAVKDGEHFSVERTPEVIAKLRSMKRVDRNSYNFFNKYVANENNLSECDYNIANFNRFIEIVKEETAKGDHPILIFNFFERVDEATDITPFIEVLASLGRQVFVGISNNYPLERFESDKVQVVYCNCFDSECG